MKKETPNPIQDQLSAWEEEYLKENFDKYPLNYGALDILEWLAAKEVSKKESVNNEKRNP